VFWHWIVLTTPVAFAVNGSALPDVDFNIGESYAGTLPISNNASDTNRLWFWFFPSDNPLAEKEITIWLNGGVGLLRFQFSIG
jgi:carboxypeptidase D